MKYSVLSSALEPTFDIVEAFGCVIVCVLVTDADKDQMGLEVVDVEGVKVLVWLHTEADPPSHEWERHLKTLEAVRDELKDNYSKLRGIPVSDGGAPNSVQRKQFFVDLFDGKIRTAAVSTVFSNPLKRGILTAMSWLNPSLRGFKPEQFMDALRFVDLSESSVPVIMAALDRLQVRLPPNETLRVIRETLDG